MFAIVLVIIGAVATGVINIAVREYYQPDVRYEESTWYYSGATAIVSLRIKNYGAADAENIKFTATFAETVRNASVSDPTIGFHDENPKDPRTITCRIDRLVPKQTAIVYFDISLPVLGRLMKDEPFVKSMIYNGGRAKTGEPLWPRLLAYGLSYTITTAVAVCGLLFLLRCQRRSWIEQFQQSFPDLFAQRFTQELEKRGIEFHRQRQGE